MKKISYNTLGDVFRITICVVAPVIAIYSHVAYWISFSTFLMTLVSFLAFAGCSFLIYCCIFAWADWSSNRTRVLNEYDVFNEGALCAVWVTGCLGMPLWYWHCNSDIRFWSVVLPATVVLVQGIVFVTIYALWHKEKEQLAKARAELEVKAKEEAAKIKLQEEEKRAEAKRQQEHILELKKKYALSVTEADAFFAVAGQHRMCLNMRYCSDGKMRFLSSGDFGANVIIAGKEHDGFREDWQCASLEEEVELGPASADFLGVFVVKGREYEFHISYNIENHYRVISDADKEREFENWEDLISYLDDLLK